MKNQIGVLLILASLAPLGALAQAPSDGIAPYAEKPSYWQLDGRPVLLLGGSTSPAGLKNDEGMFLWPDVDEALDKLARGGGNYVRCLMSGRLRGDPLWPFGRRGDRYDLENWDPRYWGLFDEFLRRTRELDIVVQIEIWATFDYVRDPWAANPLNPKNNLNYTAESSGLPLAVDVSPHLSRSSFYRTIPDADDLPVALRYQQRLVDKILAHTLRFDHVLYCIDNETVQDPSWGAYWSHHVRAIAARAGRRVFITEMFGRWDMREAIHDNVVNHPEIYDFIETAQNNHQRGQQHYDILQVLRERTGAAPRPLNNVKIYGDTGGRFGTAEDAVHRFWRNIFAGCASARFHEKHLGGSERAMTMIRGAREVTGKFDLFASAPRNDLLSERDADEAYCLAEPSLQTCAVYFPGGGAVRLAVESPERSVELRWYAIDDARWSKPIVIASNTQAIDLRTPAPGQWAVVVRSLPGK